jgi:hypothetical protein
MARPKKVTEDTAAVAAAEVKETGAKKTTAKKTTAKKAETPKEETVLTEAKEKAPAKKAACKKAEPAVTMTIQFKGKDIAAKDVLEAATKAYMEANPEGEIKTMDLYVKPDEDVAYYAVNGEGCEDYKIQL